MTDFACNTPRWNTPKDRADRRWLRQWLVLPTLVVRFGVCQPLFGLFRTVILLLEKLPLNRLPPVQRGLRRKPLRQPLPVSAGTLCLGWCLAGLTLITLAGCGGVKPVTGGTAGLLRTGGQLLSDIQVNIYAVEGSQFEKVGFGVTDAGGAFELFSNGAQGPLILEPGDYRCTIESAGAPVLFPQEFSSAETTPLKVTWSAGDSRLELDGPEPQFTDS